VFGLFSGQKNHLIKEIDYQGLMSQRWASLALLAPNSLAALTSQREASLALNNCDGGQTPCSTQGYMESLLSF
jgi:hypothetical protein